MSAEPAIGVDGVTVGHWTDAVARTGCTVVRLPPATVAAGEIRGGAPASREFALLDPQRLVSTVDAVVLTGGSAFGLASADGVVAALEAEGRGVPTRHAPVPIVVALGLYDLGVGSAEVRPDAAAGRAAFDAATATPAVGAVGAGTGATVGKWRGPDRATPGGLGISVVRRDGLVVTAIVACNAAGEIDDGAVAPSVADGSLAWPERPDPFTNTTIGVVVTNARLDATGCLVVAQGAHDGLARVIVPPHMRSDGDGFVAAATGAVDAVDDEVRFMAVVAVEQAVRRCVASIEG
ncbi:MAG: P1 family peptidase [Actinobacteria bacterium]|nr:P1 family peptidase [Actinomycetota bacterium]NIS32485.1 P1 family peptidase [Actinomycetota bacterium]NIT96100.1 P1 family peptidase [Actinomycetota bacterium]NIU19983.1 P1 family peptidase [Actinomycetota bacterium]NIU67503.1 P1 family peptidase [Actinomycetota bacterium]